MRNLFVFLLLLLAGCSESNEGPVTPAPDGADTSKNFIQTYVMPTDLSVQMVADRYINIELRGRRIGYRDAAVKREFDSLSTLYNDLSYNRKLVAYSIYAVGEELRGIDLICDRAIDAQHPAGASLNDIVKLCAVSYDAFVASGYRYEPAAYPSEFESACVPTYGIGTQPVFEFLTTIQKDDLRLIEPNFALYFTVPLPAGQYTFTLTVRGAERDLTQTLAVKIE